MPSSMKINESMEHDLFVFDPCSKNCYSSRAILELAKTDKTADTVAQFDFKLAK